MMADMHTWYVAALRCAGFVLALAFLLFALVHLYWAMNGRRGLQLALPHEGARPVFQPRRSAIVLVAAGSAACSALLLLWLNVICIPFPRGTLHPVLKAAVILLGATLLARAIGDFRHFGFFRKSGDDPFRRMDRVVYTPFSLVAGALIVLMALVI
jgi:hypothetical protein